MPVQRSTRLQKLEQDAVFLLELLLRREYPACAVECLMQTTFGQWLQEIVERMRLECLQCVSVVRGDEDNERQVHRCGAGEHLKSIEPRHPDVQKHQVRPQGLDGLDRLESVPRLADDDDVGF